MQPDQIGQDGNNDRCVNHRAVTEQAFTAEGRNHFRKYAKCRQDQDVNFRVAPDPDQVHIHHGVAAKIIGEEVRADITVKRQQNKNRGQNREGGNDQDVGAKRGPGEDRHFHHRHARCAHLDDGHNQVHARQQCTDTGNLQGPDIVINPDPRTVDNVRKRRICQPAGFGKLANKQRDHHRDRTRSRHPEAEIVQEREGNVTRANLKRHDEVHKPCHQRHRHEEDHDHAVGGKDLVVVIGRQIASNIAKGNRLLGTHHDRVGKAAQKHDQGQNDIHDTDLFMIDRCNPFMPQVTPQFEIGQRANNDDTTQNNPRECHSQDRLVEHREGVE